MSLNVGFLLRENVGSSRDWDLAEHRIIVADDLALDTLHGTIHLTRTPQGIYAEGDLQAIRKVECVRCLREFPIHVFSEMAELYLYPPGSESDLHIEQGDILNISPLIRELTIIYEPMRPLCQIDCRGLCHDCGQDLNLVRCQCQPEEAKHRWSDLGILIE